MSLVIFLQSNGLAGMVQYLPLVGVVIVMYFFMIRPQQKKQKEQLAFRDSLKKGDKVVTIGGLHGKIAEIENDLVVIDVDRGTKLTFDRSSISAEATKKVAVATTNSTTA